MRAHPDREGGVLQAPELREPRRVVINRVDPEIPGGRYPAKRVVGESLAVEADIFADGHDRITATLEWRPGDGTWQSVSMGPLGNDRWRAEFPLTQVGQYTYRIRGWVDPYRTWRAHVQSFLSANLAIAPVLWNDGLARVMELSSQLTSRTRARALREWTDRFAEPGVDIRDALDHLDALTSDLIVPPAESTQYPEAESGLSLWVDPLGAQYTAWYELFPRSAGFVAGQHGTLADVSARLPYIAGLGFSVVYLPPIHPIGESHRKGRRNAIRADADDPGSPWAIGSKAGGHTAVHPALGTLADFDALVIRARELDLDIALDLAFQCAPDHPWVSEHPEWFRVRSDGSIQYAENPPKKYQDIVPFYFEGPDYKRLWQALYEVVEFWIGHGVRYFRVDNPHTKSLYFWEWLLGRMKEEHPDVVFLAEAFTRPAVMQHLAQVGFSQSYTYFTWRNSAEELREYVKELVASPMVDYFRPSFWPNTPDILPVSLQTGGRAAFVARLVLAATLSASYGIYGPVFELMEATPSLTQPEEYDDSEKYRIAHWDWEHPDSLAPVIVQVNQFRQAHPALWHNRSIVFHPVDNDQLLVYSKVSPDGSDRVLIAVNLDFRYRQSGFVTLPLDAWGIGPDEEFIVSDAFTGARYTWQGPRNYVELDPERLPAHLFVVTRKTGSIKAFH